MYTIADIQEYLAEVERPPGGPPCAPLGKKCAVERHVPLYLQAFHEVDSPSIDPYLESLRRQVCSGCDQRGGDGCPCPLEYLSVLMVQAVDTVDQLRQQGDSRATPATSA
jgi:hypothetical protein